MSIQFTCSCSKAFSTFPLLQNLMKLSSNSSNSHKTVLYSYIEKWMHPLYFKKNFWSRKKGIIHENITSWYGHKSIKEAGVSTIRIPLSTQGFAHLGLALLHPSGDNKKLVWLGSWFIQLPPLHPRLPPSRPSPPSRDKLMDWRHM